MDSLDEIRERVLELIGGPNFIGFVNARLVLRTGISLNSVGRHSPEEIDRVIAALKDMGYSLDGPTPKETRKS
jgi:hypothetical protein